jgi:uncharacterized protein YkwD
MNSSSGRCQGSRALEKEEASMRQRALGGWLLAACCLGSAAPRAASAAQLPDLAQAQALIVRMTNQFRSQQNRSPLSVNSELNKAAQDFAEYMARTGKFSHQADGATPADRARKHGYDYCMVGENIGFAFSSAGYSTRDLVQQFMTGWEHSPGHRKNMLSADFTDMGAGVAYNAAIGRYYAVQEFGRPRSRMVSFEVANRTKATVHLKMDDNNFTIEPSYTMTFQQCGSSGVRFQWSDDLKPARDADRTYVPRPGGRLTVRQTSSGQVRVEER